MFLAFAFSETFFLSSSFAATPPAKTIQSIFLFSADKISLWTNTSVIALWKEAAISHIIFLSVLATSFVAYKTALIRPLKLLSKAVS